jgi:hypothetical protein
MTGPSVSIGPGSTPTRGTSLRAHAMGSSATPSQNERRRGSMSSVSVPLKPGTNISTNTSNTNNSNTSNTNTSNTSAG